MAGSMTGHPEVTEDDPPINTSAFNSAMNALRVSSDSGLPAVQAPENSQYESKAYVSSPADEISASDTDIHYDLVTFLSIIQNSKIDLVPIMWNAIDPFATGATTTVSESSADITTNFAFKQSSALFKRARAEHQDLKRVYKTLITELFILATAEVRSHPNIIDIEGVCWEIEGEDLCPAMIFFKASHGDLDTYLKSPEGNVSDFGTRLQLCYDIGSAIGFLHQGNIVHGDIKPKNVVVCQDKSGRLVAKLIDFGYSCVGSNGDDVVEYVRSRPWNAPETEFCAMNVTLNDVKEMDLYSFGMTCLYILFCDHFGTWETRILSDWKEEIGGVLKKAEELVHNSASISQHQKSSLMQFFRRTLPKDPDARANNFNTLLRHLRFTTIDDSCATMPLNGSGSFAPDFDLLCHANFDLVKSFTYLCRFGYQVRAKIKEAINTRHISMLPGALCACAQKSAFQLALSYKLGFGVESSSATTATMLARAGADVATLTEAIDAIKDLSEVHQSSMTLRSLYDRGRVQPYDTITSGIDLKDNAFARIRQREVSDVESALGPLHACVSQLKLTLCLLFFMAGRWKEAESLGLQVWRNNPMFSSPIMHTLALIYFYQGRYQEAEALQIAVLEINKRNLDPEHLCTLTSMSNLASTYSAQGRHQEAEGSNTAVFEAEKRVFGPEHPATLTSMSNLASTYSAQGRHQEAGELGLAVVEARKRVLGLDHPDTLNSMSNPAVVYSNQGRHQQAEELGLAIVEARKRVLGLDHPDTLESMDGLAFTYSDQGRLRGAEELGLAVIEARKRIIGPEHPGTLTSMHHLVRTYLNQGRLREAEELGLTVVEARKRILGPEHPGTLTSMDHLAWVYLDQGRLREAEELGFAVVEAKKRVLGLGHLDTLTSMDNLASTYSTQGRHQEAEGLKTAVLEVRKRVLGPEHPATLNSMNNLAAAYSNQGRHQEAGELGLAVVEARKRVLGLDHPDTLESMDILAFTYADQGRHQEAEELGLAVVEARKRVLGPLHSRTLMSMCCLVLIYSAQNRHRVAEELVLAFVEARK